MRTVQSLHHVLTYPTTIFTFNRFKSCAYRRNFSRRTSTTFEVIDKTRWWIRKVLQAESDVERDLDQLIALKSREELEGVYGIIIVTFFLFHPHLSELCFTYLIAHLVFISWINSILLSLGICLLLTSANMQSTLAIIAPTSSPASSAD